MRFLIVSHTPHKLIGNLLYAYAPYVREMNLWLKHTDKVEIVAPKINKELTDIEESYLHEDIFFNRVPSIAFTSTVNSLKSVIKIPMILATIFMACTRADHIHLRCPGNIGLLGCLVQIFFPKKIKTAKYAGNWDPKSKQPRSYRFQKSILSNTSLSKKMHVLVYGVWKNQTKNIKPFFTSTFSKNDISIPLIRCYNNRLHFVFIGSLVEGKNPLLAIKIVEELQKRYQVILELYGGGVLEKEIRQYIADNNLKSTGSLNGNSENEGY